MSKGQKNVSCRNLGREKYICWKLIYYFRNNEFLKRASKYISSVDNRNHVERQREYAVQSCHRRVYVKMINSGFAQWDMYMINIVWQQLGSVLLLGILAYIATALQLEGLSTKKPRTTKYSSKAASVTTDSPSTVSIYRVNNTKGTTCILIRTDGILDIQYRTILNEDIVANTFLPDDVDLSGDCSDEDISSMTMKFKGFTLYMVFKKTPGGERWYVSNVELSYSSSNPLLKQIDRPGLQVNMRKSFLLCLSPGMYLNQFRIRWNCQLPSTTHFCSQRLLASRTRATNKTLFCIRA